MAWPTGPNLEGRPHFCVPAEEGDRLLTCRNPVLRLSFCATLQQADRYRASYFLCAAQDKIYEWVGKMKVVGR